MLNDIQKYTEVRPVINRKQLISSIKNILIDKSDKNLRLRLLKLFKKNKLTGENKIAANFKKNKDGIRYTISRARLVDQLIMTLYEIALNNLYNTKINLIWHNITKCSIINYIIAFHSSSA